MSKPPYDDGIHEPGETWYAILRPGEWDADQIIEAGITEGTLEAPFNFGDDENDGDEWWAEEGSMFATDDAFVDAYLPSAHSYSDFIWTFKREHAVEVLRRVILDRLNELAKKYKELRIK